MVEKQHVDDEHLLATTFHSPSGCAYSTIAKCCPCFMVYSGVFKLRGVVTMLSDLQDKFVLEKAGVWITE